MKTEFIIFKKGVTDSPVTILSFNGFDGPGPDAKPYHAEKKKAFYISLGYTVTSWK